MMAIDQALIIFGPVPSRRLGCSLGINNIFPKFCSYSCVYCQVGRTSKWEVKPRTFYQPEVIQAAVVAQLEAAHRAGNTIDYLTFVPDGEPTLDVHLGEAIDLLRPLGVKIAVISNSSLIWREDVRDILSKADWVSLKVDAVDETIWKRINRPYKILKLHEIMNGIRQFAKQFHGQLVSETMLIKGFNDSQSSVAGVATFLREIGISNAYLSIPTRPTAEADIQIPGELVMNLAYQMLASKLPQVEYLIDYEGDNFSFTDDVRLNLLSITAVHPMRESAVNELLERSRENWSLVGELVAEGRLKEVDYLGKRYYVRCFPVRSNNNGSSGAD